MYSSWLLDWTCLLAGRQLYKGHKHRYTLGFIFHHHFVELSIVALYSYYTTHFFTSHGSGSLASTENYHQGGGVTMKGVLVPMFPIKARDHPSCDAA